MMAQLAHRERCPLSQLPCPADAGKTYMPSPLSLAAPPRHQMNSATSWMYQLQALVCQRGCGVRCGPCSACAACQCSQPDFDDSPTQFPHSARPCRPIGPPMGSRNPASACCLEPRASRSPQLKARGATLWRTATASPKERTEDACPHSYRPGPRNLSGEARHWDSWVPTLEFRRAIHAIRRNASLPPCGPRSGPLLPPKASLLEGRCTLILDLDETLVRAQVAVGVHEDTSCTFVTGGIVHGVQVNIRPGAAAFLAILAEWFELVAFTASCRVRFLLHSLCLASPVTTIHIISFVQRSVLSCNS